MAEVDEKIALVRAKLREVDHLLNLFREVREMLDDFVPLSRNLGLSKTVRVEFKVQPHRKATTAASVTASESDDFLPIILESTDEKKSWRWNSQNDNVSTMLVSSDVIFDKFMETIIRRGELNCRHDSICVKYMTNVGAFLMDNAPPIEIKNDEDGCRPSPIPYANHKWERSIEVSRSGINNVSFSSIDSSSSLDVSEDSSLSLNVLED
ncbi:hypothetical protein RND71_016295 [Anisodus tanguticus]|uniref:Uncharacterized protein n=1 Tax=Anisodus tanguticus TaxID=243964 RepID=A0AAE1S8M2_9SOLA|nr:hypothetical protein RND71_016295 [Anisodus tanguticus]